MSVIPREKYVRARGPIVNHCAVANLLRVVNLLRRSVFSTAGSFGRQTVSRRNFRDAESLANR